MQPLCLPNQLPDDPPQVILKDELTIPEKAKLIDDILLQIKYSAYLSGRYFDYSDLFIKLVFMRDQDIKQLHQEISL